MSNERITETIFRNHIYEDELSKNKKILLEEQKSNVPKINNLLKNASKNGGSGNGYPEFIITFEEIPDLLLVVECKYDVKKHMSCNKDQYRDYAVDGVLLYSSFLAKEYDVISIAISGKDEENLSISHFLQLKGTIEAHAVFGNKLLKLEDYIRGYKTDERKFNQDFQKLLNYSKILNKTLQSLKIVEADRSLLISGILIALSDKAFYSAYKLQKAKELAENLTNTIKNKLMNVQNDNIKNIITSYAFISTHTILSDKDNELRNIITEIDENINNFMRTYKYFDTLGQFYIEFLRYANNDKGLGIVLTPPHITELFVDMAKINKESIVLDTCTGTGGFLISALSAMVRDAAGDSKKEEEIKSKQIIGVEIQHNIFSLTCSNMYIHGDGRSNLIKGDCFNEDIVNKLKKYAPNVGFLNPPYKTSVQDKEEFEFILNNLSILCKGSLCIAIVPMSCAIATAKSDMVWKEKLLREHTLDAVFSMPTDLFKNSKTSVPTCIMVFKAKEKHPENYETYFGLWKNDGFTYKRAGGRADYTNKWKDIKKQWVSDYHNRNLIIGQSLKRYVKTSDEWCIEAYMDIDYAVLTDQNFKSVIKDYSVYLFSNELVVNASRNSINNNKIDLNTSNWNSFRIGDYFNISTGGDKPKEEDLTVSPVNSIENLVTNNGVKGLFRYNGTKIYSNFISMVSIGEGGRAFYHKNRGAIFTRVKALIPNNNTKLNSFVGMFLVSVLNLQRARYSYGRVLDENRIKETTIKLPTDSQGNPDWQFMEDYIKTLPYSSSI